VRAPDPADQALVIEEVMGAGATGHHHDLGIGQILECRGGLEGEHGVVGVHEAGLVGQLGHACAGQAREHLVGDHGVEGGESVVQRDCDSHAACLLNRIL
jgi:hypothetical protein